MVQESNIAHKMCYNKSTGNPRSLDPITLVDYMFMTQFLSSVSEEPNKKYLQLVFRLPCLQLKNHQISTTVTNLISQGFTDVLVDLRPNYWDYTEQLDMRIESSFGKSALFISRSRSRWTYYYLLISYILINIHIYMHLVCLWDLQRDCDTIADKLDNVL